MAEDGASPPNILTLILDVTPSIWGHRDLVRHAKDKALAAKGAKGASAGPATLEQEVLTSILSLGLSFSCLNRDNVLIVIAATDEECAVLYPRKGGESVPGSMDDVVMGGDNCTRVDGGLLNDYVKLGVAELVNRAAERIEKREQKEKESREMQENENGDVSAQSSGGAQTPHQPSQQKKGAVIAAALSLALCTINRFMVASHAGVSALADASSFLNRREDEGILALMGGSSSKSKDSSSNHPKGLLQPRALVIQSSPDRTSNYNALMNCAFAATKSSIVIDGCFIPGGGAPKGGDDGKSSPFLEQIVDMTGGVYLSVPSGAAQVGGALTEVLMSVFLPPPAIRKGFNFPKLKKVDFRARCFETGESIDIAEICNQCLSIFKTRPKERCLTCGALVRKSSVATAGSKKMKLK